MHQIGDTVKVKGMDGVYAIEHMHETTCWVKDLRTGEIHKGIRWKCVSPALVENVSCGLIKLALETAKQWRPDLASIFDK